MIYPSYVDKRSKDPPKVASTHAADTAMPDLSNVPSLYHDLWKAFKPQNGRLPDRGRHNLKIELVQGRQPPFGPLYPLNEEELRILSAYIEDMLARSLIRPSQASCGAPVLFARKKDGSLRLCVDYRHLNDMTIKNVYPLPLIHEMLDRVSSSKIFTKLDLKDA